MRILVSLVLIAAVLSACGQRTPAGGIAPIGLQGVPSGPLGRVERGTITFRVKVPIRQEKHRIRVVRDGRPSYISVDTQALSLAIKGPTNRTVVIGLTKLASDCTTSFGGLVCTANVALAPCKTPGKTCYSADVTTYDAWDDKNNTIPPAANVLSLERGVAFTIAAGQANRLALTLSGVAASIVAVSADGTSEVDGATISLNAPGTHEFYARAFDADGDLITGLGAPNLAVAVAPTPALTVAQPPNSRTFRLTSPRTVVGYSASAQLKISASYLSGETNACAHRAGVCKVSYAVSIPLPITFYTSGLAGGADPYGMTSGPDGNLWFTEPGTNRIGKSTTSGAITEYSSGIGNGADLLSITSGPDGNLWFTEEQGNRIGTITPTGVVTEYSSGISTGALPVNITAGPDGNLWFTELYGNRIGTITPSGAVTEYSSSISNGAQPYGITSGPDGNLWFTEQIGNRIGTITPSGTVTEYSSGISGGADPPAITRGPDGNLWFTETTANRIGKITTSGTITEYSSGISSGATPFGITLGSDGNLWFTEVGVFRIGRITTAGVVTEFSIGEQATGITAGPDGNIWFTLPNNQAIGKLNL